MEPKITIKRDRYSRLTYIVETSRGAPFLYRRLQDVPLSVLAHVRNEVKTFLGLRGLLLVEARPAIERAPEFVFSAHDYDWAREAVPKQYTHNAIKHNDLFSVTCDMDSWYVLNPHNGRLHCVGRAKSKGRNYRDKAEEVADRMSSEMRDFYRELPEHRIRAKLPA